MENHILLKTRVHRYGTGTVRTVVVYQWYCRLCEANGRAWTNWTYVRYLGLTHYKREHPPAPPRTTYVPGYERRSKDGYWHYVTGYTRRI